ncbi:caspase-2-like [Styela clava]
MAWEPPEGITLEEAYDNVMGKMITHRSWTRFARRALRIDSNVIDEIKADNSNNSMEQKHKMLEHWKQSKGNNATPSLLYATVNYFLFPDECPDPNAYVKKPLSPGKECADAEGFNDEDPGQDIATGIGNTRISDIPVEEYCSKVDYIDVKCCAREFWERNKRRESNYACREGFGRVLIMNNSFIHHGDGSRHGSDVDVKNMEDLWLKLGCIVDVQKDLHANDMIEELRKFSDFCDKPDYCVIIIMSHGKEDAVFGNDSREIRFADIIAMFNNENAPNLQEIPKAFFFQCCRGDEPDQGVPVRSNVPQPRKESPPLRGRLATDANPTKKKLPTTSDMLISYATQHGKQAYRHTENGSWFINAIANVFMRHAKEEHMVDLMTKVNNAVKKKSSSDDLDVKAMSHNDSTLTKKLYLYPGHRN